jgi:DNA repair protein RecN (Recombination protein N)
MSIAIPEEAELLVRRNVGTDGRSRAWLNGQSVPLQVMRSATELLLDIHGQQEFQSLVRPTTQRELIDSFGRSSRTWPARCAPRTPPGSPY